MDIPHHNNIILFSIIPTTLVTHGKKIISKLKNARFSGKGRQSLHKYINVMRIRKILIYCVKLDHALYSINYGTLYCPEDD